MREILRTLVSFESPTTDATRRGREVNANGLGTDHDSVCGRPGFRASMGTPPFRRPLPSDFASEDRRSEVRRHGKACLAPEDAGFFD
jgi:hypothetical protein